MFPPPKKGTILWGKHRLPSPKHPQSSSHTSWEIGVLGIFWGSNYLLIRCLDVSREAISPIIWVMTCHFRAIILTSCNRQNLVQEMELPLGACPKKRHKCYIWEAVWVYNSPIGSMYGIFTYIWLIFMANVGEYTIHGSYGSVMTCCNPAPEKKKKHATDPMQSVFSLSGGQNGPLY